MEKGHSSSEHRVAAAIDLWKRKLLDLSKRNKALNFKPDRAKVSTVTIVDERPEQVFEHLYLQGASMRFRAMLPEPPKRKPTGSGTERNVDLFKDEAGSYDLGEISDEIELPPLEEEALDPNRHADDILQAHATPSALDRSLRRIAEQALTTIEEQGVNALYLALGMLHYQDAADSERELRAPIVLLPVALSRRSAGSGFTIKVADDEPAINPALAEYLQRSYGLTLPTLPDSGTMAEDYNLQTLLDEIARLVKDKAGWNVLPEIYLALFSFQKLVMYRDLEANADHFLAHPLLRKIVAREGEHIAGLPPDIQSLDLDRDFAPEATAQVVDADSSQLRAIAAVAKGHDFVLLGPPGTGKSQTITNLIAQALADGKRVLFVAEKKAALDVVHRRLEAADLSAFCLEMHGTKASKRDVLDSIKIALDASVQTPTHSTTARERLPALRSTLNNYVQAVHAPHGTLDVSPYVAYGRLGSVLAAPKVRVARSVDDLTQTQITDTLQNLDLLARAVAEIGDPSVHPWRDTTRTYYAESDLDEADALLSDLTSRIVEVRRLGREVADGFGLPPVVLLDDTHIALAVATVLEQSPGAPASVLQSNAWNQPPPRARALVADGRTLMALHNELDPKLAPEALETDHTADIAFIEEKEASAFRWLNFLNSRYRHIKKRWTAYRLPGYSPTLAEQAEDMKKADALRFEHDALYSAENEARALFGSLWAGADSDWDSLDGYIRWVTEFRAVCVKHGLDKQAAATATRPHPDISLVRQLDTVGDEARDLIARLRAHVGWPEGYLADTPLDAFLERVRAMKEALALAPRWAGYEVSRSHVAAGPAAELLPQALAGEVAFSNLASAFRRAFYQKWLDGVVRERPLLREFHTLAHEQRVEEFQHLDRRLLLDNRHKLVGELRDRTQALLLRPENTAGLGFLRGQLNRQRGHAPLRRTLREAGSTIRCIKPCFLMSPLTVAQFHHNATDQFDLVIFDEASQLTTEDAVGAIVRGKQLVVVGDPKQLPPTNFFAVMTGQITTEVDEEGYPIVEETESILEECLAAGIPNNSLKWHYRSREESLITFSNASFYGSDLLTFPSVYSDAHARGLAFEYVADGVYEGKGLNAVEARRVADAVVEHVKRSPKITLGVGTFNLRQQIAILDELELRRRQDPGIEPFFDRSREEPFFVKNLENIQGDERDEIFLSVTYAKNHDGVLRHNFGPINGENGWRRLNVITTRARQRMRVFSSMRGDEIDLTKTQATGARLLREFLLYAERGRLDSVIVSATVQTESPFEAEVLQELSLRGLRLQPQVGVAGYRIDLGVLDDEVEGRFICGLECDGASYHASETARDRDRLRQQVLESRGWTLHRIWSTDWFKDRSGQIERILAVVKESRREAREEATRVRTEREAESERVALEIETSTLEELSLSLPETQPLEAVPYAFAKLDVRNTGLFALPFHEIPISELLRPIRTVVEVEAPLHIKDLATRLAAAYGFRQVGKRIAAHVARTCAYGEHQGLLKRREDFIWALTDQVSIRSRTGTGITAERIAPEEYRAAAVAVLQAKGALDRRALVNEIRALFGFNRTGAQLEQAIQTQVESLLLEGKLGEGGTGLMLRS